MPGYLRDNAVLWHDVPAYFFADSASSQAGHLHALRTSVKLLELPAQLHALAQRTLIGHVRIKPPRTTSWLVRRLFAPASWLVGWQLWGQHYLTHVTT